MEIKEILEERSWEEFLTRQPHTSFLQSWAWGEFQDKLGLSHHRFGTYQGGALDGICQALVGRRKLGSFVYVPRGPILKSFENGRAQETLKYLRNFAAGEKVDYLRVEPHWEANLDIEELFREEGYRRAQVVTSQAGGVSLLLDLSLSEEDLLAQMRKTTRYLVRSAEGLGMEIHRSADPRKMEEFQGGCPFRRNHFFVRGHGYLCSRRIRSIERSNLILPSLGDYQGGEKGWLPLL